MTTTIDLGAVQPGWVDHYGHMNMAYYLVAFDAASDALWPHIGLGPAFKAQGLGTFAAETWLGYRRELLEGQPIAARAERLAHDEKRLLLRYRLFHAAEGWEAAVNEVLFLCVDLARRKVTPWPEATRAAFAQVPGGAPAERLALKR